MEKVKVRALIGWMSDDKGALVLAENRLKNVTEDLKQTVQRYRASVQLRPRFSPEADAVLDAPAALQAHMEKLKSQPHFNRMLESGWKVVMADLNKLIALQPYTELGVIPGGPDRSSSGDLARIAAVTLPPDERKSFPVQYDPEKAVWYITSTDASLSVVGNWSGPVNGGIPGFGFGVMVRPAFLSVVQLGDRFVLADGYHRALYLMQQGITVVPALFRQERNPLGLAIAGEPFSREIYLGERPPFLKDYLDDKFSIAVSFPQKRKVITIQATELRVLDP